MVKRPRFFYGWVIVAIAIIIMTLSMGIRHSFGVFFPAILNEFNWSRGSTARMLSLNLVIFGLLAPVAGSLADRWRPKIIMFIGIIIVGLSTAGCAFAQELWHFYLAFGIFMPIGTAFSAWPLLAPAISNWFTKRVGLAIGLGQMGGGLSFVYSMLAEWTISQMGWRHAYFVLAGILVVVLLPLSLFFYYRPENKGLKAYGITELTIAKDTIPEVAAIRLHGYRDWTLGYAMKSYQLWLLMMTHFLYWGIGVYLVLAHQVKFAEDAGYSSMFATAIFALFGIAMVSGQLSASVSDRIGREVTVGIAIILAIIGIIALISVRDSSQPWLLYVYSICFGYGTGLYTPTIFAGAADIFRGRHFGAITGLLIAGMGIGGAIGPWLGGYLYDISGSYNSAFALCMACFGFACITFLIVAPRNAVRLREKSEKQFR